MRGAEGKNREQASGSIIGLYRDIGVYIGIMEKKMETLGPFKGTYRLILGLYRDIGVRLG